MNENNTPFYYGTIIIGPSGSGKSTFGKGLHALLGTLNRKRILINLDPANYNDDERVFDLFDTSTR
jgi:uridine kinase